MKETPPVFIDHGHVYTADTCAALREAADRGSVRFNAYGRGHYAGTRLPKSWLPGLMNVGYWDAPALQEWGLDWHRNEGIEFSFLSTGRTRFAVDNSSYRLSAGALTVTRPWQKHRVGEPNVGPGRLHWIILDVGVRRPNQAWQWPDWVILSKPDRDELTRLLRQNEHPVWPASDEVRHSFARLDETIDNSASANRHSRLAVHLNELLLAVFETLSRHDIALDPALSSSQRTVELFLEDLPLELERLALPWTAQSMADHCGLGVSAFTQYCREISNRTPMQYVNHCRVQAAAQLLIETPDMTVTEIAHSCGFQTSQYFATAFRQRMGCSPRAYRREKAISETP